MQPGFERMHYDIFVFDGAGKFAGKQSSSLGGNTCCEKLEGTYTLDFDCTGDDDIRRHHESVEQCALGFVSDGRSLTGPHHPYGRGEHGGTQLREIGITGRHLPGGWVAN